MFWPRDMSPVLRIALEANGIKSKSSGGTKWCRPVILTKEDAASYQIHMKSGPYLHVCVLTHEGLIQSELR